MSVAGLGIIVSGDVSGATGAFNSLRGVLSGLEGSVKSTFDSIGGKIQSGAGKFEDFSKGVGGDINQIGTSMFSLYKSFDAIGQSQISLDRTNLLVRTSTASVTKAQEDYTGAVAKFGSDSPQARAALDSLETAQERLRIAQDRAAQSQGNLGSSMMSAALTVIPTLGGALGSLSKIMEGGSMTTGGWLTVLGLVITALIAAYQTCPWFRDAVNQIATVLSTYVTPAVSALVGGLTWLWNNVLTPLGNIISGLWVGYLNAFGAAWTSIVGIVGGVWDKIKGFWDWIQGIWSGITGFFGALFGGGQQASTGSSPTTTNYSGVPVGEYQSAYASPVMFTRPTPIIAHRGEVLGGERALGLGGAGLRSMTVNQYFGDVHRDVDLDAAALAIRRRVFSGYELR